MVHFAPEADGWFEYFFQRLQSRMLESFTIRAASWTRSLSEADWSVICNWIKLTATSLKRLVIENHKLNKTMLRFIKSAIGNTKSPLIEIEIFSNTFEGVNKESLDEAKKFVRQVIDSRSETFNIWAFRREFRVKNQFMEVKEHDPRFVNQAFQKNKEDVIFAQFQLAGDLSSISKLHIAGCESSYGSFRRLMEQGKFPQNLRELELKQVLSMQEQQLTELLQLLQDLPKHCSNLKVLRLNIKAGNLVMQSEEKERLSIMLTRAIRKLGGLVELSLFVIRLTPKVLDEIGILLAHTQFLKSLQINVNEPRWAGGEDWKYIQLPYLYKREQLY